MAIELKIPEVGESITEVQIAEWLKAEGDTVQKDEPVVVIDSEKTTFELPAPESGTLGKILRMAGETVPVGEVIGHLESGSGDAAPAQAKSGDKPAAKPAPKPQAEKPKAPQPAPNDAAPVAQSTYQPKGIGLVQAKTPKPPSSESRNKPIKPAEARPANPPPKGSEEGESEEKPAPSAAEPESKAAAKPALPAASEKSATKASVGGEEEIVPMSMLRRTVARRLVEAKQQMAMLTTINEVDMSAVLALRREHQEAFEKRHQVKLGLMSFFVKATVDALKQFPQLNAEVRGNGIVYRNYFNIGVAIATGRGLVVPVFHRAERFSFADIEKDIADFATRAKEGKLKPDELEGATFTITNGGVFGSLLSTPIINPPQSGILGMHTIQERPVAVQGQVVIRPMMYLALTYDHRIVDGREAVLFLRRIKEAVESPARMLLEV